MNKLLKRIVGLTLGFAMVVGAGVANAQIVNNEPGRVEAAENDTHEFIDDIAFSRLLNNDASIDSVSIAQQSYTVKKIVANVRYNKTAGGVTITPTIGSTVLEAKTHNANSTVDLTWNISPAIQGAITFDFVNNCGSGTGKGTFYFNSVTLTEGAAAGSPTVASVSLSGSMSTTSYTTVQSWSNSGLTASGTMTNETSYTGEYTWTYSPTTPAQAVIDNNNEEVTGLSVTATASAQGKQASKATTGISVSYAMVAQGLAAVPNADDEVDGVIVRGTISYIDEIDTSTYHNATYYISDNGSRTDELEIYRGKGLNNANFTNSNDIQVGDVVLVYGNLKYYNGTTKEFLQGNYILDLDRPASPNPSITIVQSNFSINVGDDDVTLTETHENVPDGGSIKWESSNLNVATVGETTGVVHAVGAGSATITAKIVNSSDVMVASNSITVTVTNISYPVSDGDAFIVKYTNNTTTYYFSGIENDIGQYSETKSDAIIFIAEEGETSGQFYLGFNNVYLSFSGSSNKIFTSNTKTENTLWTIVSDGTFTSITNVAYSSRVIRFNTNSGQERFCCYTSGSNVDVELVEAPAVDTVTVVGDSVADAGNAASIVKEFSYEVTYVNPLNPGSQAVSVTVLNSSDGTDGASVTTAPSNGSFSVTFTISDTYTVTVVSLEDNTKSDSTTIVVSNIYTPVMTDYELYSGTTVAAETTLAEGDYIFYYGGYVLKAGITSNRAQYDQKTPSNDTISTNDASIVWHVAKNGDYYTIYNAGENKYLASTGTKNQAKLESSVTDNSRWRVTVSEGTFEFENLARSNAASDSGNKWLRNNGTSGWACYSSQTGGALSLYRRELDSYIGTANSIATLSARETAGGGQIEEGSVVMRFGITMPKASWDSINAAYPITDYGVMCLRRTTLNSYEGSNTVEQAYRNGRNVTNFNRGNGDTPYAIENTYKFNVRIENIASTDYNTTIVVAPYILAGGQYYFFREMEYNVRSLAQEYLNDNTLPIALSNAALRNLAGVNE